MEWHPLPHQFTIPGPSCYTQGYYCPVCDLEATLRLHEKREGGRVHLPKELQSKKLGRGPTNKHHLGICGSCPGVYLHGSKCPEPLLQYMPMFSSFPDFIGKTCYEIFHLHVCRGLWNQVKMYKADEAGNRVLLGNPWKRNQSHEVYHRLRDLYKIPNLRKKKAVAAEGENGENDQDED